MLNLKHDRPVCLSCGHPRSIPGRTCESCGSECDWGEDERMEPDCDITAFKRHADAEGER